MNKYYETILNKLKELYPDSKSFTFCSYCKAFHSERMSKIIKSEELFFLNPVFLASNRSKDLFKFNTRDMRITCAGETIYSKY